MTTSQLQVIFNRIKKALSANHYQMALLELEAMGSASNSSWEIRQSISKLQESYGYLLRYALDGIEDPMRGQVLADLRSGILAQCSLIMRNAEIGESPRQYYGVLRYERLNGERSIPALLEQYRSGNAKLGIALLGGVSNPNDDAGNPIILTQEALARRIFQLLWVTYPLTDEDETAIEHSLCDDALPLHFKELMISAVLLGALEAYDERRLVLLAGEYMRGAPHIEVKALCALLIAMWMQRMNLSGTRFKNIMEAIKERKGWRSDLKMVFMQLVRTRDTDRISRTMMENVIPEMMKLRSDITDKLGSAKDLEDLTSLEENPEWAEIMEKSGVMDKLKELSEIQADGGDVMMSTFSHLKSFPFFSEISNWFLPFHLDNSAVASVLGNGSSDIGEVISASPMMCDSDKYSIVLSLERLPKSERRMMLEQFKMHNINIAELRNSELNPESMSRDNIANKYIQDLYRFYKLYRRKGEFHSPFDAPVNLASVDCLSSEFDDTSILVLVAEFYFKHGYYDEALGLFKTISDMDGCSPQLCQKIGYCYQQSGDTVTALDYYLKSELLSPDSLWTLRRIAQCYKLNGDSKSALDYYLRVAERKPDSLNVAYNIGTCHLELGEYDAALKQYFKVEFLDDKSDKALRPIAWCLFLSGDMERSMGYYQRILANNSKPSDNLNYGHLLMAMRRYSDAIRSYRIYYDSLGAGADDKFEKAMSDDVKYLSACGVDTEMLDIVIDSVLSGAPI